PCVVELAPKKGIMPFTEYLANEACDSLLLAHFGLLKPQTSDKHRLANFTCSPIHEFKDALGDVMLSIDSTTALTKRLGVAFGIAAPFSISVHSRLPLARCMAV